MATSEVIKLKGARLSFAKIWEPKAFHEGQTKRFEASFLIDPSSKAGQAQIATILEQAEIILEEKFNGKIPKSLEFGFGWADGTPVEIAGNKYHHKVMDYDGYEGMFFVTSANTVRPVIIDNKFEGGAPVPLVEADGRPYSGCYVNGTITLWTQDNAFGKRVNGNLRGIQFLKHGDAFGVKPADAAEEFDDIEDVEDENGADWDD